MYLTKSAAIKKREKDSFDMKFRKQLLETTTWDVSNRFESGKVNAYR